MAVLDRGLERVEQAGLEPLRRVARDAELLRDRVGRAEADAPDLVGEPVRVRADHADRVLAVLLDDARRERRRHAVALQEHHHVLHVALLGERLGDLGRALARRCPIDLGQPLAALVDHLERLDAELLDHRLRELGTDARDDARAEEALDPDQRLRRPGLIGGDA